MANPHKGPLPKNGVIFQVNTIIMIYNGQNRKILLRILNK